MNWRWKNEDKLIEIGEKFVIAPPWIKTEKLKITFVEGKSFGTGVHETTVSCMELMEGFDLEDKTVLDIGIGSGILSVAALKLGAKEAVGFDIEAGAIEECRKNIELNSVENLECFVADSAKSINRKFDFIFANIFSDIIISMKYDMDRLLKNSGYMIFSGIIWEENYTVKSVFGNMGFRLIKNVFLRDYTTMVFKK